MTYAEFHFVFILPVIALLAVAVWRQRAERGAGIDAVSHIGVIAAIAFVYTIPWDNYLVYREVWGYGADRVLATIGYVPVEEYAFFILQPILTGLWYLLVRSRIGHVAADVSAKARAAGVAAWLALTAVGAACVAVDGHWLYLGLILAWACPILALMWGVGGEALWANRRTLAWAILPPTLWLWVADRIAIGLGIWYIAEPTKTGFEPLGLPIEEALFFLITNVLVVQGLLLLGLRRVGTAEARAVSA
jgi:lycopene cyclase domain-containing protein